MNLRALKRNDGFSRIAIGALLLVSVLHLPAPPPQPVISTQPQSQLVSAGNSATFTVVAAGAATLYYQWRFNASDLSGATDSSLTLTNVQLTNAGNYSVVVSNSHGTTVSSNAVLSVNSLPVISDLPDQRTFPGRPTRLVAFSISDLETAATNLTLTGTSSDTNLVLNENIFFGGTGSNRTVTVTPAAGLKGTATITVAVQDAQGATASKSFQLTVADFTEVSAGFTAVSSGRALWGDYDNDGDLDVLITGFISGYNTGNTTLYRNDGGGVFTQIFTPFLPVGYSAGAWGDYDADGNLDLVISGMLTDTGDGYTRVYHNNGNGTFSETAAPLGSWFGSECWGDYDLDGDQDLLQAGRDTLLLYRNDGGTLTNSGTAFPSPGVYCGHAIWADFDNDGDLDLHVAADPAYPARSRILRNDGNGAFVIVAEFPHRYYNSSAPGDYDNDGDLDLVMAGNDPAAGAFTKIYRNDGNLNFTETAISLPGAYYSCVAWGDYDNDGDLDLLLGGASASGNVTRLYRNDGGDNFTEVWTAPQELSDVAASWGDYDNDGDLDFILCGLTNGVKVTRLFRNDGAMSNKPPSAPGNLSVQTHGRTAAFTWSAATDAEQPGGLSYNVRLGTTPGGVNRIAPKSDPFTGFRRVPELGNSGLRTNSTITNLTAGTYYWSVQAIDHAFAGSGFAPEQSFTISVPIITNQPQAQTLFAGQTASFTVGASGNDPLTYQWRFNGTNLPGATNATLVVSSAQFVQQGNYSVTVSDVVGTATSSNALLTVNSAPVITAQPRGQTIPLGGGVTFNVGVIGNTPFFFQWFFNDVEMPGETNSTLSLSNLQFTNAGNYSVVVSNWVGLTVSSNALLSVHPLGLGVQTVSSAGVADMVYDDARDILYLTGGNSVRRFHLGSNVFLTPFQLGPNSDAYALDLSFDRNTLAVADHNGSPTNIWIYLIDLMSGDSRQVTFAIGWETGMYSLGFGNDGALLMVSDFTSGSTTVPLRRYDSGTDTTTSIASVFMKSLVTASGDGNFMAVGEGRVSSGRVFKYDVASRQITGTAQLDQFSWIYPGANRNGTQFTCSMDHGTAVLNGNMQQIYFFGGTYLGARPVGAVYHPTQDLLFLAWGGSTQVIAHDTTSFAEFARYDFGTYFGTGERTSYRTRISRDGSLLMVNVGNAIKCLRWASAPPQITANPASTSADMGSNTTFSVAAIGTPPFSYQWFFNGVDLPGATDATLTLTNLQPTQGGSYRAIVFNPYGAATSSVATLTLTGPPVITNQPKGATIAAGSDFLFTVSAVGTTALSYEWRLNGSSLVTSSQNTLTIGNAQDISAGDYTVIVANSLGSVTSSVATLIVTAAPPTFTIQPQNQTIAAGESVTFSAYAAGSQPIYYQWQFNGTNLVGQTDLSLSLANLQAATAGDYSVIASNSVGTNVSAIATLTVAPAIPTVTAQPISRSAPKGAEVLFTTAAKGTEPFSYQWRFNSADIPGATTTSLLLTNIQSTNAGGFTVVITNDAGATTSSVANLTISPPPGFLWARRGGGIASDAGNATAVDPAGNIYFAGSFSGTATFGGSNVVATGATDAFLAKYDPAGNLLWLRQGGGLGEDGALGVATDTNGNVYVTGYFMFIADFGDLSVTNYNIAVGNRDIFVAKHDSDGNPIWVKGFGAGSHDQGNGIAVDPEGNVFITGYFYGTVAFGGTNLVSAGNNEIFLAKLDPAGGVLWARKAGGTSEDYGQAVTTDKSGNAIITGYYVSLNLTLDSTILTNAASAFGRTEIFLAKYDGNGSLLWARKAGGLQDDQGKSVCTDDQGNIFLTGQFASAPATFESLSLSNSSSSIDVFLAKYDQNGNILWVKSAAGTSSDYGHVVAADAGGNCYLAGRFSGSINFGFTNLSGGGIYGFIAAYSAAGNGLWARRAGGGGQDQPNGLALDKSGYACLAFQSQSSIMQFGHIQIQSAGSLEAYLAKLATVDPLAPPSLTLHPSNQTVVAGANVTLSSGFVGPPPVSFQWRFNGSDIPDATGAVLVLSNAMPAQAGGYSVVLSNLNGAITSAVATVTVNVEPDFLWAVGGGGATNDEILGVVSDTNGNTYVAGYFSGTASLGGTNLTSTGGEDIFVAKFDGAQNLIWARQAGGDGNDRANSLLLDATGTNVIVAGQFSGTADFGGQVGSRVSTGGTDMFVAGYRGDGLVMWAQRGGGGGDDAALGMALATNGQFFVTGYFQGSATIAGSGLNSAGTNDMFLAKYSNNGGSLGARSGGGSGDDRGRAVTCDSAGNVYVAGGFTGTANFSGVNLTSLAGYDAFVVKYDSAMNRVWARRAGTSVPPAGGGFYNDEANAIAADRDGNLFVAGYFHGQAAFGSFTNTAASTNQPDAFLAKYDPNGTVLWAKQAGGTNADLGNALATDFGGNAYLAGAFNGVALFSPFTVTNVGGADLFVAMYDAAGRLLKVRRAGGVGDDAGLSVAVDGRGNAVVGGGFTTSAAFGSNALVNVGGKDAFVTKVSFFDPDTLPVITSQPVGASTSFGSNALITVGISSGTPLQYQWFLNGNALAGATGASVSLTNVQFANLGSYFVVVSNNFGAVTSATAAVRIEVTPEVLWTLKLGSTGDDQGLAVAVDPATNVYVAGLFSGTVAFGTSNLVSSGGTDIFFAKYNALGGLVWAKKYGGSGADSAQSLTVDAAGNVFLTGLFSGTAAFGNSNLVSSGNTDLFVAKHDSAGNLLWLKRAGNTLNDQGTSITTDGAGNAYVTGSYFSGAAFGNIGLTNLNYTNFFLVKYDPAGNAVWARTATGVGTCQGSGVAVDAATNVYVTGYLFGSANFGSGVITNTNGVSSFGNATVFIAKYDREGGLQWAKKGGTNGLGYGQNIVADAAGGVFATSYKRDYGGGVMLTKYDGGGNVVWVRTNVISCCTGDYISVNGLALDNTGNPVLAGGLTGSGLLEGTNFFSPQQGFIVKYRSKDSTPFWIFKSGQMGNAVALDAAGNAYVAGRFSGTGLFGTSSNLVSAGGNDAFLVKFGVRPPGLTALRTNLLVVAGSNAMLQVAGVTGTGPFAYQWQFNGTNLAGATQSSLALNSFNFSRAGRYSVVVQNFGGSATSQVAALGFVPVLNASLADSGVVLSWDGEFTLQSAADVAGPYTDLPSATSPFTNIFPPDELQRFFRLRVGNSTVTGTLLPNQWFSVGLSGSPGRLYAVQASTNLADWVLLQTDASPFTLQDSNAVTFPQRFYRARLSP